MCALSNGVFWRLRGGAPPRHGDRRRRQGCRRARASTRGGRHPAGRCARARTGRAPRGSAPRRSAAYSRRSRVTTSVRTSPSSWPPASARSRATVALGALALALVFVGEVQQRLEAPRDRQSIVQRALQRLVPLASTAASASYASASSSGARRAASTSSAAATGGTFRAPASLLAHLSRLGPTLEVRPHRAAYTAATRCDAGSSLLRELADDVEERLELVDVAVGEHRALDRGERERGRVEDGDGDARHREPRAGPLGAVELRDARLDRAVEADGLDLGLRRARDEIADGRADVLDERRIRAHDHRAEQDVEAQARPSSVRPVRAAARFNHALRDAGSAVAATRSSARTASDGSPTCSASRASSTCEVPSVGTASKLATACASASSNAPRRSSCRAAVMGGAAPIAAQGRVGEQPVGLVEDDDAAVGVRRFLDQRDGVGAEDRARSRSPPRRARARAGRARARGWRPRSAGWRACVARARRRPTTRSRPRRAALPPRPGPPRRAQRARRSPPSTPANSHMSRA